MDQGSVVQALPPAWLTAALPRSLNTATSTIPDASAANMARIDPPSTATLASPDAGSVPEDQSRFRSDFAHFLRDASTSEKRAEDALQSMGKYLRTAKAEVDQHGRSSVLLDQHVIMNYITCEDILLWCDLFPMTCAVEFLYRHCTVCIDVPLQWQAGAPALSGHCGLVQALRQAERQEAYRGDTFSTVVADSEHAYPHGPHTRPEV